MGREYGKPFGCRNRIGEHDFLVGRDEIGEQVRKSYGKIVWKSVGNVAGDVAGRGNGRECLACSA